MKGIILHGGHGTRLRPLTHTGPKQLLPIANKPMSEYCVEALRDSGITDIAIVVGGIGSNKVKDYYQNLGDKDDLYQQAVEIIRSEGKASTSFLQRKLQIGYNRAARIIDMMEANGIVSKANHKA